MSESKAALGAGNVEITLDGKKMTLRPTLKAALAISRQAGGIARAVEAVGNFDIDTMATVVALGLDNPDTETVAEMIYRSGVAEQAQPIVRYLTNIASGGRTPARGSGDGNFQTNT